MNNDVISFQNFSFTYRTHPVLENVNLAIAAGVYVSIIGPNGAGKSTLLKCLNRIVKGGRGAIEILGKDIHGYSQKQIGRFIAYVSQIHEQMIPYTVFEFVLMGRYPYLSPFMPIGRKQKTIVEEALAMLHIEEFAGRPMTDLSGGERQKVYLAAAFAQQPQILLLDEPTAHLDPKYHIEIQQLISKISKKQKITVLHVTHDLNHIFYWSEQVVAIKEGRVLFDGPAGQVLTKDNLNRLFQTEFLIAPHPESNIPFIVPEIHSHAD